MKLRRRLDLIEIIVLVLLGIAAAALFWMHGRNR